MPVRSKSFPFGRTSRAAVRRIFQPPGNVSAVVVPLLPADGSPNVVRRDRLNCALDGRSGRGLSGYGNGEEQGAQHEYLRAMQTTHGIRSVDEKGTES